MTVGAMTGFFGVGGGFLIVPTLTIALALSIRLAGGVPQRQLGAAFAGLVVLAAAYLLVPAAFLGGPPGS